MALIIGCVTSLFGAVTGICDVIKARQENKQQEYQFRLQMGQLEKQHEENMAELNSNTRLALQTTAAQVAKGVTDSLVDFANKATQLNNAFAMAVLNNLTSTFQNAAMSLQGISTSMTMGYNQFGNSVPRPSQEERNSYAKDLLMMNQPAMNMINGMFTSVQQNILQAASIFGIAQSQVNDMMKTVAQNAEILNQAMRDATNGNVGEQGFNTGPKSRSFSSFAIAEVATHISTAIVCDVKYFERFLPIEGSKYTL